MERSLKSAQRTEASPIKIRPTTSLQDILTIAAAEFDCDAKALRKRLVATTAESNARAATVVMALEIGHSRKSIAEFFSLSSQSYLPAHAHAWASTSNPRISRDRLNRMANIRFAVQHRMASEIEFNRRFPSNSDERRKARNKQISDLRRKGWSIKGIARHCDVQPVEVCDVLGVDRALARAG